MKIQEMHEAVEEAKNTLNRADIMSEYMAKILVGRLRRVDSHWVIKALKQELSSYNVKTGTWKE